ncbi:MAG: hypothetical protein CM15mP14_0550 [Rhodospirillaceae bacterium]|nr:MAG: hypothetical protein CM15mP14_0550 [Rhodospirillaceae bacterium]
MADETELNLNELDDEVVSEAQDEDEVEEVYADDEQTEITSRELEAVYDIPVQVSAVLGKQTMQVTALKLGTRSSGGARPEGCEAIDFYVNKGSSLEERW